MKRQFLKDEATMIHANRPGNPQGNKLMRYGMMACCAVMLIPVGAFFVTGGSVSGLWANAGIFAPLILCAGGHVVMHRMMGKSCHGDGETAPKLIAEPIPVADDRPGNESRTGSPGVHATSLEG
ncbi:DUF2933 domain-containing protein [Salipiger abyssi]|uniref:DUF2933 domain-containing protein n=1 Tax=Salipiger abyssi TaxID=1250539 RepID=UPI0026D47345